MMLAQAEDEWFAPGREKRRLQMRKLMLIAGIALMTATPCYANLSVATADTSPVTTGRTEAPAKSTEKTPTKARPAEARRAKPERTARVSRHRQPYWAQARFTNYSHFFHGGC
jgi:hypothetical protein